jgi:hypothetical protein
VAVVVFVSLRGLFIVRIAEKKKRRRCPGKLMNDLDDAWSFAPARRSRSKLARKLFR